MKSSKYVERVYKDGLCCSCGLCSNYCSRKAISYKVDKLGFYKPIINTEKCTECGLCERNCPGSNDLKNYNSVQESYCYGYSNNEEMRMNAASGGIATELLCYLIEKKYVDYVTVVTNRTSDNPQQLLTNDVNVIRECRTSKYCPVKWNDIVEAINKCEGTVAVVALPCQINSLKKYYDKRRKNNVKYYISLLCNHTPSLNAAKYIAKGLSPHGKLLSIINRGGGWPGFMKYEIGEAESPIEERPCFSKGRQIYLTPYRKTWGAGYGVYFKNLRCVICNDPFSKNADIVLGDAYFLQETDTKGTTYCIVRNDDLNLFLREMVKDGVISLKDGPDEVTRKKYYKVLYDRECNFDKVNSILKYSKHRYVKYSYPPDRPKSQFRSI